MARNFKLSFKAKQFSLSIKKIDRKKLYGYTSTIVHDDEGAKCSLATVSDDGKHILSKGCVGYAALNARNEYIPSSDIRMVDKDGKPIEKILSSFDVEETALKVGAVEDYLQMHVKAAYQLLAGDDGQNIDELVGLLKKHQLLYFKFNYRTDYDNDDAFILQNEGIPFMVIGQISPFEFIGLEKVVDDVVETDDEDDFDFGML